MNGTKQFITNGARAGTYVVLALTAPEVCATRSGKHGVSAFVVESDTPGLSVGKPEDKLGMRSSDTVTVMLEDVRVTSANLLGIRDEAFVDVKMVLERGRVMIAAISLGLARGALEDSLQYSQERKTFGKPIFSHLSLIHI